jgi:hypothetical protein
MVTSTRCFRRWLPPGAAAARGPRDRRMTVEQALAAALALGLTRLDAASLLRIK